MRAKHTVLYREQVNDLKFVDGIAIGEPKNKVVVELSEWRSEGGIEYILRTYEVMDGKMYHSVEAFDNRGQGRAHYIRRAIHTFDSLVKTHPNLGKET